MANDGDIVTSMIALLLYLDVGCYLFADMKQNIRLLEPVDFLSQKLCRWSAIVL